MSIPQAQPATPYPAAPRPVAVDVVTPVYGERSRALERTIRACLEQSHSVTTVYIVDDGSPEPVTRPQSLSPAPLVLIRLEENRGISAARNAALRQSSAPFVACVNVEVVPAHNWLSTCLSYLERHPAAGAAFTRVVPRRNTLASRWRMRFQEQRYDAPDGVAPFAPGHAVLFRRAALDAVGGYDEGYRRINEDGDIGRRMAEAGWETHYVTGSVCTSLQADTVGLLARKQLIRRGWDVQRPFSLRQLVLRETRDLLVRAGRNLLKGRLLLIVIDVLVWTGELALAARHRMRQVRQPAQP